MKEITFYDLLGVSRDADHATIKAAYRRASQANHPDAVRDDDKFAGERFKAINEAWATLSDDEHRIDYDMALDMGDAPEVDSRLITEMEELVTDFNSLVDEHNNTVFENQILREHVDVQQQQMQQAPALNSGPPPIAYGVIGFLLRLRLRYRARYSRIVWRGSLPLIGIFLAFILTSVLIEHNTAAAVGWAFMAIMWIWTSRIRTRPANDTPSLFYTSQPVMNWLINNSFPKWAMWLRKPLYWIIVRTSTTAALALMAALETYLFLLVFMFLGSGLTLFLLIYKLAGKFVHIPKLVIL